MAGLLLYLNNTCLGNSLIKILCVCCTAMRDGGRVSGHSKGCYISFVLTKNSVCIQNSLVRQRGRGEMLITLS